MISDTVKELLGYTSKELLSKPYLEFVVEEDREKTQAVAEEIISGKPAADFTNHYLRKDGTSVPITWSATWIDDDKLMYCIARNATVHERTARQLAQSQSRLAHAQKIAKVGNWDWDLTNDIWSCSDQMYELIGIRKEQEEDMQQRLLSAIHPDDLPLLQQKRHEALTQGKAIDLEHRIIRADGTICYVQTKGEVVVDQKGRPVWFTGTMQDISEQKKSELELKQLNEYLEKQATELKASNVELEQFAYVASHDLQEPLRMITSFLTLLQKRLKGSLDETSAQYIHFAVDGSERMKQLVQDLLHYSRLNEAVRNHERVSLDEVLKNVLVVFHSSIEENGAQVQIDSELPVVEGNKTQLVQLFQNLTGNALKYRDPNRRPEVVIGCREQENEWLFFVRDNGIGIDPKFFTKIFVIFQRLHNKTEYSGTGIGLAICKKIVERHGGRIWVDSKPGEGSTFYFTLKKYANA
jgi:two-component system CheB/CheR fusion protein